MTDDLPARVAALELLVEQLILERAKKRARPQTDVRAIMGARGAARQRAAGGAAGNCGDCGRRAGTGDE